MLQSTDTPHKNDSFFLEYMTKTLTKLKKENKNIFITGDFNFNLLCANKKEIFQFLDLMYLHFLQPHIIYPSRIVQNTKPSLLDNIFSNHIDEELHSGNIIDKVTDHMPPDTLSTKNLKLK